MIATLKGENDIDRFIAPIMDHDEPLSSAVYDTARAVLLLVITKFGVVTESHALTVSGHVANCSSFGEVLQQYTAPANARQSREILGTLSRLFAMPFEDQVIVLGAVTAWLQKLFARATYGMSKGVA